MSDPDYVTMNLELLNMIVSNVRLLPYKYRPSRV